MPRAWVKTWWSSGVQDVYNLASLFQVSVTAMDVRLRKLGMIDPEPERDVRTYFRRAAGFPPLMGGTAITDTFCTL